MITLVGVNHANDGLKATRLMCAESETLFQEKVLRLVGERYSLVLEGSDFGLITPTHESYRKLIVRELGEYILEQDVLPYIVGPDTRVKMMRRNRSSFDSRMQRFFEFCTKWIHLHEVPRSTEEMIEVIRSGRVNCDLLIKPIEEMKKIARELRVLQVRCNRAFKAALEKEERLRGETYLIAGLAHTIELYAETTWSHVVCVPSPKDQYGLEQCFRGVLDLTLFPEIVCNS